jgi:proteasome lid subunit RPN8/RPN11
MMTDWREPPPLILSRYMFQVMRRNVMAASPEEACGILAADETGRVRKHFSLENVEHSPVRYRMDPGTQFQTMMRIEESRLVLLAIYHSHPNGPAIPSATDLKEWFYPESYMLIWHRVDTVWQIHAFLIRDDRFQRVPILYK